MSTMDSWYQEKQSAWFYRILAETERDAAKRVLFRDLSGAAEEQAGIWALELEKERHTPPQFHPSRRALVVAKLIRWFGVRPLQPVLAAMKVRGLSVYKGRAVPAGHPMPASASEVGQRHKGYAGGSLRAAVFGVNDGLVSNTSLVMGIAGASGEARFILTAGIAGLLAGAFSMAAGEYLSMRSQREMYEYQIALERSEYAEYPDEEAEELALIYAARGMRIDDARRVAKELLRDEDSAMDVLSREELGLNPEDLGSPWGAAIFSFGAFTAGAIIPLAPFLLGASGGVGTAWAGVFAALCLLGVGAALSLFTGRNAVRGGLRMLFIGSVAAIATYFIGHILGVTLA